MGAGLTQGFSWFGSLLGVDEPFRMIGQIVDEPPRTYDHHAEPDYCDKRDDTDGCQHPQDYIQDGPQPLTQAYHS